jgi:rod shape-determining protein MreC
MDNLLSRHRNVSILVAVLFAQVLGLAVQVKRDSSGQETRLIRLWVVEAVTPFEKSLAWIQNTTGGIFHNYIYLRGVRAENRQLKQQIEDMRLQQVRLEEDASQARRLQLLLGFKEKFIQKTVPAQVIGTSGTEQSRSVYIDKGFADGIKPDQAVITAEGIVGKILHVYDDHTSSMLLVNDTSSGVGVILESSRIQGVLRGMPNGQLTVEKILSDESIQPGERVLTSGGDQIFPKGLGVGVVSAVKPGKDSFLDVRVKPGANLSRLEEVLVITHVENRSPSVDVTGPVRAADILAQRLPSVPDKPAVDPNLKPVPKVGGATAMPLKPVGSQAAAQQPKPAQGDSVQPVKTAVGNPPLDPKKSPLPTGSAAAGTKSALPPATAPAPEASSSTPNATAPSPAGASAQHASVKPASTAPAVTGTVKPAVAQAPVTNKTVAPAHRDPDKSAGPASQNQPQTAPVEDKPE